LWSTFQTAQYSAKATALSSLTTAYENQFDIPSVQFQVAEAQTDST
jgi:hypothetical protein